MNVNACKTPKPVVASLPHRAAVLLAAVLLTLATNVTCNLCDIGSTKQHSSEAAACRQHTAIAVESAHLMGSCGMMQACTTQFETQAQWRCTGLTATNLACSIWQVDAKALRATVTLHHTANHSQNQNACQLRTSVAGVLLGGVQTSAQRAIRLLPDVM